MDTTHKQTISTLTAICHFNSHSNSHLTFNILMLSLVVMIQDLIHQFDKQLSSNKSMSLFDKLQHISRQLPSKRQAIHQLLKNQHNPKIRILLKRRLTLCYTLQHSYHRAYHHHLNPKKHKPRIHGPGSPAAQRREYLRSIGKNPKTSTEYAKKAALAKRNSEN